MQEKNYQEPEVNVEECETESVMKDSGIEFDFFPDD